MSTPWKFSQIWTQNLGVMTSPTIHVNTSKQQTVSYFTTCYNELYCQGTLRAFASVVGRTHNLCVRVCCVSLYFACFDLNCWRCHSSEDLGLNWTKFSGNAHNNNIIPCRKFGTLKMNRNVHSGTCSSMNFIARNFVGTTIRYKLTFPENLVKFGQKTWAWH